MGLFSERYGYTKPSDVIIREQITPEIESAICNCYEYLQNDISNYGHCYIYQDIKQKIWTHYLNRKLVYFDEYEDIVIDYLESNEIEWFYKLDLIEFTLKYLDYLVVNHKINQNILFRFIYNINNGFERLNFAYRIIDNKIVEITSTEEIAAIEESLENEKDNIKVHLKKALDLYAKRPVADYCNSIKESISAVEAYCREKTGENTLGAALNKLEKSGVTIPPILKVAFDKLYAYTNQPDVGIRHALMDSSGTYVPKAEEALFMLVSCSAFINYLNKKK